MPVTSSRRGGEFYPGVSPIMIMDTGFVLEDTCAIRTHGVSIV